MSPPPGDDASPSRRRRTRPPPTPGQRALGLLVRREHSRKELQLKLEARGVTADEARSAVEQMAEAGWQSNQRFAESLLRSRAAQGHGPIRIRAELATHGVDEAHVEAAFAAFEEDWNRLAFDLVQRRFGSGLHLDRTRQRKAAEFLLRRGFSTEQMRRATRSSEFDEYFDA
ncbi:regulatory protein RecX [Luteimonas sp. e5]